MDFGTISILSISVVFILMLLWIKCLRKYNAKGREQNGVETIAIIDKYDTWGVRGKTEWCCFFHFECLSDGKTVYGRTIVRDWDFMQRDYPPNTRIRIIYQADKTKNWRIVTDEKGYYVKA